MIIFIYILLLKSTYLYQGAINSVYTNPCIEFNELNTQIRDTLIEENEAKLKMDKILPKVEEYFKNNNEDEKEYNEKTWIFPVKNYNKEFIGGKNGSGFIPNKYNYYNGNKHGGHSAHDIFVFDKNFDSIDDITKKYIEILSLSGGIVVALEEKWDVESELRGGVYIWIYDPLTKMLFYYAHNKELFVKLCQIVKPGDLIAYMGRTGLNAYKKRSPTHLHLGSLKVYEKGKIKPFNIYKQLIKMKTIKTEDEAVKIPGKFFQMDKGEVTNKDYNKCVKAEKCEKQHYDDKKCDVFEEGKGWGLNFVPKEFKEDDKPVVCVDFKQAKTYCEWINKRLPTEEEWEYAAKGGKDFKYSGSNNADLVSWYYENSKGKTNEIARKKANNYGLFDMTGNVWEWTDSRWDKKEKYRVLKGGCFSNSGYDLLLDFRHGNIPSYIVYDSGFRCAKDY